MSKLHNLFKLCQNWNHRIKSLSLKFINCLCSFLLNLTQMFLSFHQSQFNCRCVMPWKSQEKKYEKKVESLEAKKFFVLSHQIPKKAKTQYNDKDYFVQSNNATGQSKRSLRRKKSNNSEVLQSAKLRSQNQKIYQNQHPNILQFHPFVSQFSNSLCNLTQQNIQLNAQNYQSPKLKQKQIMVTPNWRQTSSNYCSPEVFSIINSHNQTPAVTSPKKIHFPISSDNRSQAKDDNNKSRSMKGFNRFLNVNNVVEKHFNQLLHGDLNQFDVKNPQNYERDIISNSFQSQNFSNCNFSLPNNAKTTNLFAQAYEKPYQTTPQRKHKNSEYTSSQITQSQLYTKRRLTVDQKYQQRCYNQFKQIDSKNKQEKGNLVQFSNYSQTISRNSSNNNLTQQANSRKVLSRDSSMKPFDQMHARKVSSIFDSRQNQNQISVVIPGATLITQMSEEKQTQSPKFPKIKRRLSCNFDGTIVLKQVQVNNKQLN